MLNRESFKNIANACAIVGTVIGVYELSNLAFSFQVRQETITNSGMNRGQNTHVHHVTPTFMGGSDDIDNAQALSRVQHALTHLELGMTADVPKERSGNFGAAKLLSQQMTDAEFELFNQGVVARGHSPFHRN